MVNIRSHRVFTQLWRLCMVSVPLYFLRFGASGFGLPQIPTHLMDNVPALNPSIGLGFYTGMRIANNLDFSDNDKPIKLENVTQAIIETCPKTYVIFQQYLNQAKDEKDFFKRFVQVAQTIVLVNLSVGGLFIPHDSNFIVDSTSLATASITVSATAREMAKAISRNENVDGWTINFLYFINDIEKFESFFQKSKNQFKKDELILNSIIDRYYAILDEYNFLLKEFNILSDQLKLVLKNYKISFLKDGIIFDLESCEENIYCDKYYILIQHYENLLAQYEFYFDQI